MKQMITIGKATIMNCDCMEYMAGLPDKAFDLAIVDPPYGIDAAKKPISMGKWKRDIHKSSDWDNSIPDATYFAELLRVSRNQIIWGGNYFLDYLNNTRCMIVWDKNNGTNPIHPTQKPVKLYEWLLTNYAKPGQRILDTHLGSMSSVIAANNLGFELTGCELDADYFKAGCARVLQATAQQRMFP